MIDEYNYIKFEIKMKKSTFECFHFLIRLQNSKVHLQFQHFFEYPKNFSFVYITYKNSLKHSKNKKNFENFLAFLILSAKYSYGN